MRHRFRVHVKWQEATVATATSAAKAVGRIIFTTWQKAQHLTIFITAT